MVEKQLSLTWNHHGSTYRSMFNILRQKNLLTDITLACDGCQFSAHKLVLATCSQYFQAMLCAVPDGGHPIVYLRDVSASEMKAILEFMYTGEACLPQSQVGSLLKTAESLKIKGLGVQPTHDADTLVFNDDIDDVTNSLCDDIISQSKIDLQSDERQSNLCSKSSQSSNKKRVFPTDDQDNSSKNVINSSYSSPPIDLSEPSPKKRKTSTNRIDFPPPSRCHRDSLSMHIPIDASNPTMARFDPRCSVNPDIKSEPSSPDLMTNAANDDLSDCGPKSEKTEDPTNTTENCNIYDSPALSRSTNDALAAILDLEEKFVGRNSPLQDWDTRKPNFFPVHTVEKPKETPSSGSKLFPCLSESPVNDFSAPHTKHPPSQDSSSVSVEDNKKRNNAGDVIQEVACSNASSFEEEAQLYLEAFTRSAGLSASALRSVPEEGLPVDCSTSVLVRINFLALYPVRYFYSIGSRIYISVSESGPYRPSGGVEEMQGGGRRVRLEWGAYITV
ncbi:BTB/POZ domain [Trinorchestia longiramus]|nr:BTB/POZ domain [Trinorchestia longiramus]